MLVGLGRLHVVGSGSCPGRMRKPLGAAAAFNLLGRQARAGLHVSLEPLSRPADLKAAPGEDSPEVLSAQPWREVDGAG